MLIPSLYQRTKETMASSGSWCRSTVTISRGPSAGVSPPRGDIPTDKLLEMTTKVSNQHEKKHEKYPANMEKA